MTIQDIRFQFEGRSYAVGINTYEDNLPIKLPDGRVLIVSGWLESMPPKPQELTVLKCSEAIEIK